jgi:hypothetical protein
MEKETLLHLNDLISTYEKLIITQNKVIQEKDEIISILKRTIEVQDEEKELEKQLSRINLLNICLN